MKRYSKLLSLVLVLIFTAIFVFSGCAAKDENGPKTDSQTTAVQETTTQETSSAANDPFAEHVKFKMAFYGWGKTLLQDKIYEDISKKFNMEMEFIGLDWADWQQKVRLMAASDELPDLCYVPDSDYAKFAIQNLLKPLPDDMSPYPELQKLFTEAVGDELTKANLVVGKQYKIPHVTSRGILNNYNAYYLLARKDWMQQCGITKDPETITELMDMCQTFVDKDLAGGKKTGGYASGNVEYTLKLFQMLMSPPAGDWTVVDGKWTLSWLDPKNTEWIKLMQKYYKSGAIWPDFPLDKSSQAYNLFWSGKMGVYFITATCSDLARNYKEFERATGIKGEDGIKLIMLPKNNEGKLNYYYAPAVYDGLVFSAKTSDAVQDRILRILDYFTSDEGIKHGSLGLEGRDYKMEGDKFVSLLPLDEKTQLNLTTFDVYPTSILRVITNWNVDFSFIDPGVPQSIRDEMKAYTDNVLTNGTKRPHSILVDKLSTPAKDKWSYQQQYWDGVAKIVAGNGNVDEEFKKLTESMLANGGNDAINEVNSFMPVK